MMHDSEVLNFFKCRILVETQLSDFIVYGFPLNFDRFLKLISAFQKHESAIKHEQHID